MATNLIKGPFTIRWGGVVIEDVSEIGFNYDVNTNDYQTVDGRTYQVEGAITASVDLTLLASDTATLRVLFPQYYVPTGSKLSTGETVTAEEGAIDIKAASCDQTGDYNHDLEIVSCGDNGETTRLVNARTTLSTQEFADNALRTVTVSFIGEPAQGQGIVQFFKNNGISDDES